MLRVLNAIITHENDGAEIYELAWSLQACIRDRRAVVLQRKIVGLRVKIDALEYLHKHDAVVDFWQSIGKLDPSSAWMVAPDRLSARRAQRTAKLRGRSLRLL